MTIIFFLARFEQARVLPPGELDVSTRSRYALIAIHTVIALAYLLISLTPFLGGLGLLSKIRAVNYFF